jgi:L-threonylcarbamoyladenylate synthase
MSQTYQTEILPTRRPAERRAAIRRAVQLLKAGEVVALPTETVYGLAANALDPAAVAKLFQAKGRPAHNPIIVHVSSQAMARRCVRLWSRQAQRLAAAFWPGPLTLVLHRSARIPDSVTAHGNTVGIRWPRHPIMQAVIRACGFPLAAPSANRSSQVSPTRAQHVWASLAGRIPLILDGGSSEVGIESTVLDLTQCPPRVLRPGMIHEASLIAALGSTARPNVRKGRVEPRPPAGILRSPGMLAKHYAPRARLRLLSWHEPEELEQELRRLGISLEGCHVLAHTPGPQPAALAGVCVMPRQARAYARALYTELHRCDAAGAEWIVVEEPPPGPAWRGIADRLTRAASPSPGSAASH